MGIGVGGDSDLRVAQDLLDYPEEDSLGQHKPGGGVAQVVELRWTPKFGQVAKRESRS